MKGHSKPKGKMSGVKTSGKASAGGHKGNSSYTQAVGAGAGDPGGKKRAQKKKSPY